MSYIAFSCFSEEYLQMGLCTGNNTFKMGGGGTQNNIRCDTINQLA